FAFITNNHGFGEQDTENIYKSVLIHEFMHVWQDKNGNGLNAQGTTYAHKDSKTYRLYSIRMSCNTAYQNDYCSYEPYGWQINQNQNFVSTYTGYSHIYEPWEITAEDGVAYIMKPSYLQQQSGDVYNFFKNNF
ncbi:MAG TPA: hypothetical protein VGA67_01540, partial [Candidatus Dojkabacteria bacterium]